MMSAITEIERWSLDVLNSAAMVATTAITPPPTVIGIGRDTTRVAFDDQRELAATMDEVGVVTLWNTDVGEQIGQSFMPLEGEKPASMGFSADGLLVVGAESSSVIIPTDPEVWITRACTLIDWLNPDHPLHQRLQAFDRGCA